MNAPYAPMMVSEHRPAGRALAWLALVVGVSATAFLSTPWPPGWVESLLALALWAACAAAIWTGGREHEVLVDPAGRSVNRRVSFLGLGLRQRWSLDEFDSVVVERRQVRVAPQARAQGQSHFDTHTLYVLSLKGPGQSVELQRESVLAEAEKIASELARRLRLLPRREGYSAVAVGPGEPSQLPDHLLAHWRRGAPRKATATRPNGDTAASHQG